MTPPASNRVYVVRWRRIGNRPDIGHRFFTRQWDALNYATKLRSFGRNPTVYTSTVDWKHQGPGVPNAPT